MNISRVLRGVFLSPGSLPFLVAFLAVHPASSQNIWSGGGAGANPNWNHGPNWHLGAVPANDGNALVVFDGLAPAAMDSFINNPWRVKGIEFLHPNSSSEYHIRGEKLSVGEGGILSHAGRRQRFYNPVELAADQFIGAMDNGAMNFFDILDVNGKTMTVVGRSRLVLDTTASLVGEGQIIILKTANRVDPQNPPVPMTIESSNIFTGTMVIRAGTVELSNPYALFKASRVTVEPLGSLLLDADGVVSTAEVVAAGGQMRSRGFAGHFGRLHVQSASVMDVGNVGGWQFDEGIYTGGTLTVSNWVGAAGMEGSAGRLFVFTHPSATFLDQVQFVGFNPGAYRLGTGELVPDPNYDTWTGGGANDNWSTGANWESGAAPLNDGSATVVFGESPRRHPRTDVAWSMAWLVFDGSLTQSTTNSGSELVVKSGLMNNSTTPQAITNRIRFGGGQSWFPYAGDLLIQGPVSMEGWTLTIEGSKNVHLQKGSVMEGTGQIVHKGSGSLMIESILQSSGGLVLQGGKLEFSEANLIQGQDLTLQGGNLQAQLYSQNFGRLSLGGNSVIEFSTNAAAVELSFSEAIITSSQSTLTIRNWVGLAEQPGLNDRLMVAAPVDPEFLVAIHFEGFDAGAMQLPSGEIVPKIPIIYEGPRLISPTREANVFRFVIKGAPGRNYSVHHSSDLVGWSFLESVYASSEETPFEHPVDAATSFYKVTEEAY